MKFKCKPLKSEHIRDLPKGDYYIGDPCYVIPQKHWTSFCNSTDDLPFTQTQLTKFRNSSIPAPEAVKREKMTDAELADYMSLYGVQSRAPALISSENHNFLYGNTLHGDGGYEIVLNNEITGEFGVDAGCFAVIPLNYLKAIKAKAPEKSGFILKNVSFHNFLVKTDCVWHIGTSKGILEINTTFGPLPLLTEHEKIFLMNGQALEIE